VGSPHLGHEAWARRTAAGEHFALPKSRLAAEQMDDIANAHRRGWPTSWLRICPRSTFWWSKSTGCIPATILWWWPRPG
jgi:hypothetical protein